MQSEIIDNSWKNAVDYSVIKDYLEIDVDIEFVKEKDFIVDKYSTVIIYFVKLKDGFTFYAVSLSDTSNELVWGADISLAIALEKAKLDWDRLGGLDTGYNPFEIVQKELENKIKKCI